MLQSNSNPSVSFLEIPKYQVPKTSITGFIFQLVAFSFAKLKDQFP